MNGTHIAIGGGLTGMLAALIVYFTHWPLQPMDTATASDLAGLIVSVIGGGGFGIFKALKGVSDESTNAQPAPVQAKS